jgi:hypothetical protein
MNFYGEPLIIHVALWKQLHFKQCFSKTHEFLWRTGDHSCGSVERAPFKAVIFKARDFLWRTIDHSCGSVKTAPYQAVIF